MFIRGLMKTFVVKTVLGSVLTIKATHWSLKEGHQVLEFLAKESTNPSESKTYQAALVPVSQIEYCYEVDSVKATNPETP
jgi:hypothetical protein